MNTFLGIDGGGSKTECVLMDDAGTVLGRALGRGRNLRQAQAEELREILAACLAELRDAANLEALTPAAVCGGFAGASDATARERAQSALKELFPSCPVFVVGDMEVALEAAFGEGPGVVVISGTGSIAFGRNAAGQTARAGGEGFQLSAQGTVAGDAGSGSAIGWQACRLIFEGAHGEKSRALLKRLRRRSLKEKFVGLLMRLSGRPVGYDLMALAHTVLEAAREGDVMARAIVDDAAANLAQLGLSVLRQLGASGEGGVVALSGGMFAASEELTSGVRERIRAGAPGARIERLEVSPGEGAARLARRLWQQGQGGAA